MDIKIINHPGGIIQQTDKPIVNVFGNINVDKGEQAQTVTYPDDEYADYTELDNDSVNEVRQKQNAQTIKKKSKKVVAKQKPRETMTFKKKSSVLDGHITLLFNKLTKEGWIEGNEADFKALFSGKQDEDCIITWLDKYGKAALFTLFNAFEKEGLIIVPDGFGISTILEGHFKDKSGQWLSGLDKGNRAHAAALPVIMECVKLLKKDASRLINGDSEVDEDFNAVYDPHDHQDLNLHRR